MPDDPKPGETSVADQSAPLTQEAAQSMMKTEIDALEKRLTKVLESLKPPPPPDKPAADDDDDNEPPATPDKPSDIAQAAALAREQRKRKQLEDRVNELESESRRAREDAERTERFSQIKSALREAGVTKVELAFKAIKDDVMRADDGQLYGRNAKGEDLALADYVGVFIKDNPEFQPPRVAGGSGAAPSSARPTPGEIQFDDIKPGMTADQYRQAAAKIRSVLGL